MRRGEIYLCDFGEPIGHEPGYRHPAIVVSHDEISRFGIPVVIPITSTRRGYPTHVEIDGVLPQICYAQCELVTSVSHQRLSKLLGLVSPVDLLKIEKILRRILVL
jgi:mRNA interferase MazF